MGESTVTISLSDYDEMLVHNERLFYLLGCIFKDAKLSYNGEFLTFDSENLCVLLREFDDRYYRTLERLQKEKEKANEQSNSL